MKMSKKVVKKVNIDELVDVLLDLRKFVQHVDISIEDGNIIRVKRHEEPTPPEEDKNIRDDLNQLLG
jgi:hypothetical protein